MHQQIRTVPAKSPPDLVALLEVLANAGVNLAAVGGSDLELGGEFAFSVSDEQEDLALRVLGDAGYKARTLELAVCWMEKGTPGELLRCVREATYLNAETGSVIRDLAIGEPDDSGRIPVRIYSQEVKTGRRASAA